LKGKKVYVATSRGGIYPAEADPQVPFVRMLLNFLGMTDHTFIHSPAQAMGPDASAKGRAEADATIESALA
jgi:FMN-dependent NADH-azoreductase